MPCTMDEYQLVIKDLSPETTPMSKLACYLEELAKLMGEKDKVYFVDVQKSSLAIKVSAQEDASAAIDLRLASPLSNNQSASAFAKLQHLLALDNTTAEVKKRGQVVLSLVPVTSQKKIVGPREKISIRGKLITIGGKDPSVPFSIVEQHTNLLIKGNASIDLAMNLAKHLFATLEIDGTGTWRKSEADSEWELSDFVASEFRELSSIPLLKSIEALYSFSKSDAKNPLEILKEIREQ